MSQTQPQTSGVEKRMIDPTIREEVLRRDGYKCVAPRLDPEAGPCRDRWDQPITFWRGKDPGPYRLEMNHVKDTGMLMMGRKAPTDVDHLVSLCPWHHRGTKAGSNWEAVHRDQLRAWVASRTTRESVQADTASGG
jgi:hypothetical protein